MTVMTPRWPAERVDIDRGQLARMGRRMSPRARDRALEAALEELACRLYRTSVQGRGEAPAEIARNARRIGELARMTGLVSVADLAAVLDSLCRDGTVVERAAVSARLARVGEQSILQLWDLQDLSL